MRAKLEANQEDLNKTPAKMKASNDFKDSNNLTENKVREDHKATALNKDNDHSEEATAKAVSNSKDHNVPTASKAAFREEANLECEGPLLTASQWRVCVKILNLENGCAIA